MNKGHYGSWLEEKRLEEPLQAPENFIYEYELGNQACLEGEAKKKEALLHYLSGMEMLKAWDTDEQDRKEFFRAVLLLGIADTMEGLIPVHSRAECIDEAEMVFWSLCSNARLQETIDDIDVKTYAKLAGVLWGYSVESRNIDDVETIYADVLLEDCLVGDLWLDEGPHGLIITEGARQSFICDFLSDKCTSEILLKREYILLQGVDPTVKIALKVHHHGGVSRLIETELAKHIEFPMFPNYKPHSKLSRCFGQNCEICGEEKYSIWETRFWNRKAKVCLDCIKSGRAGKENKGIIYEAYMMQDSDEAVKQEILYHTPQPFNSWMNTWRTCCGKYARYIGRKKKSETEQWDIFKCRVCGKVYEDMCSNDEINTR